MTACGGNIIGCEISRNEQGPHEGDLRRLRLRTWGKPLFSHAALDAGRGVGQEWKKSLAWASVAQAMR